MYEAQSGSFESFWALYQLLTLESFSGLCLIVQLFSCLVCIVHVVTMSFNVLNLTVYSCYITLLLLNKKNRNTVDFALLCSAITVVERSKTWQDKYSSIRIHFCLFTVTILYVQTKHTLVYKLIFTAKHGRYIHSQPEFLISAYRFMISSVKWFTTSISALLDCQQNCYFYH